MAKIDYTIKDSSEYIAKVLSNSFYDSLYYFKISSNHRGLIALDSVQYLFRAIISRDTPCIFSILSTSVLYSTLGMYLGL